MELFKTAAYILVMVIIALFASSTVLAVYAGVGLLQALLWSVGNLMGIAYQGLIPEAIALNNWLVIAADAIGAISFAVLTALLTAIFYSSIRNINVRQIRILRKIRRAEEPRDSRAVQQLCRGGRGRT